MILLPPCEQLSFAKIVERDGLHVATRDSLHLFAVVTHCGRLSRGVGEGFRVDSYSFLLSVNYIQPIYLPNYLPEGGTTSFKIPSYSRMTPYFQFLSR